MKPADASDTIIREITIDAPAERIFEALINPDQRLKWWGAEGLYRGTVHGVGSASRRQVDNTGR
jgi:uncharacterized protein YndB with AHSA1/START domain